MNDTHRPPSILQSGLDIVKRDAEELRKQGRTVAVVAVANPSGVSVKGSMAWDTKSGRWEFSAELEKLKDQKSVGWEVAAVWSR